MRAGLTPRTRPRRWCGPASIFPTVSGATRASAANVLRALNPEKYDVVLIGLAKAGYVGRGLAEQVVRFMVVLNISLMFFNLLPIPPLDGGSILAIALPARWRGVLPLLERYGMLLIILLFMTGLGSLVMRPAARLAAAWAGIIMGLIPG